MKPSLYILQESKDGITFVDATNWKTGAVISSTNLDTLYNYIHRYRESNTAYYYRIKGTAGSANPIYSNVITKTYKLLSNYRKGLNYDNGTVWLMQNTSSSITEYRTGGKIRNVKKNAILPAYIGSAPMGKYGDELIFESIKSTFETDGHTQIIAYNTLTEAIRIVKNIEATDLYPSSGTKCNLAYKSFIEGNLLYYVNMSGVLRITNLDNGTMQSFITPRTATDGFILDSMPAIYKINNFIYYIPARVTNTANQRLFYVFNTTTQTWETKTMSNPNNISLGTWKISSTVGTGVFHSNLVNNKIITHPLNGQSLVLELEIIPATQDIKINTLIGTVTSTGSQYLAGACDTNGKYESGSNGINAYLEIVSGVLTSKVMNGLSEATLAYDGNLIRTRQTLDAIITPSVNGTVVNPLEPEHNRF
jgi:hypothetical protein